MSTWGSNKDAYANPRSLVAVERRLCYNSTGGLTNLIANSSAPPRQHAYPGADPRVMQPRSVRRQGLCHTVHGASSRSRATDAGAAAMLELQQVDRCWRQRRGCDAVEQRRCSAKGVADLAVRSKSRMAVRFQAASAVSRALWVERPVVRSPALPRRSDPPALAVCRCGAAAPAGHVLPRHFASARRSHSPSAPPAKRSREALAALPL